MKNKKNVIIAVMIAVALLMATGYAYFATQLNINATGNITSNWNVYFESISNGTIVGNASNVVTPSVSGTSANMNVNLNIPGDSITYNIVLKNGGTVPAIIEDIDAVATGSGAIIYSISGLNIGDKLSAGASKTITIKIEYDPKTTGQPSETSKQLTVTIDAAQDIGQSITSQTPGINQSMYLSSAILKNNTAYADNVASPYVTSSTGIDFEQPSSDTNGKGLYYTSTNTEGDGTTYYFRGNVENNYVSFGTYSSDLLVDRAYYDTVKLANAGEEIIWRIVRINEDGSIRLISHMPVYGNIPYGDTINFGKSNVKTKLEEWYTSNLSAHSSLLADAGFCNEMFDGYQEYIEPQFKCSTPNNLYTLSTSNKGNKVLTSPIGLLTLDEVMYGGSYLDFNSAHSSIEDYQYNGWRTMTGYIESDYANIYISASGYIPNLDPNLSSWEFDIFVRPVINLKSNVEFELTGTGEPGSITNPYVIKTN